MPTSPLQIEFRDKEATLQMRCAETYMQMFLLKATGHDSPVSIRTRYIATHIEMCHPQAKHHDSRLTMATQEVRLKSPKALSSLSVREPYHQEWPHHNLDQQARDLFTASIMMRTPTLRTIVIREISILPWP